MQPENVAKIDICFAEQSEEESTFQMNAYDPIGEQKQKTEVSECHTAQ
jgi:hypothetical protein